ncbi:BsuPI-related putative proteinase inhibitor [Tumebacillus permanentifrigoris]|uniref:Uncharacterized protein n=1 Tax=Tumebacillus permanentifrigoris TaxID=378543 RepID=A0A316D469_9BACL|nr:BsuPI-related putative proteinase inhibitor [Tumebacillus permanentifrigoris]PWK04973.1 hypothetical protein C7459_1312 [Tumebacillus permanentifrigoris]
MKQLVLTFALLLPGCSEKGHASDPTHNLVQEQNGVKLSVTLDKSTYAPTDDVVVHVEATNEGQTPIAYTGYNSCDPGLNVHSTGYKRVKKPGESDFCASVIVDKALKPQETIALAVTLHPEPSASTGSHTVQAIFQRGKREEHMKVDLPFEVN